MDNNEEEEEEEEEEVPMHPSDLRDMESHARILHMLGDWEGAAFAFARAARHHRIAGRMAELTRCVLGSCEGLRVANRPDDVLEGLRAVAKILLSNMAYKEAQDVADYSRRIYNLDPERFARAAGVERFIGAACREPWRRANGISVAAVPK